MAYSIERMPERISIGRETETGVTDVMIDCGALVSKWPGMALHAIYTPEGGAPYILQTETDGGVLVWHVTDADTATPGTGSMEIVGETDGRRKVSATVKVSVAARMSGTVGEPPEAAKPWADRVVEAAERITGMKVQAETLDAGSSATAAWDGEQGLLTIGVPKGKDGKDGADGKDAVVDTTLTKSGQAADAKVTGDALALKLTEPSTGLAVGKYFRIAAIDESGHAVLEAVDLPSAPVQDVQVDGTSIVADGVANVSKYDAVRSAMCDGKGDSWSEAEQAAARERIGEFTDSPLATVADVTLDKDVSVFKAQLANPCRFITCTFIIPPEIGGQNRSIYFAANVDKADVLNMFARSATVSTTSTISAFYLASALIVGRKILSFGCIASNGTSISDHQTRPLNNPPNGFCVLDAQNFETIMVYTYGTAFPAGSRLVVTGC